MILSKNNCSRQFLLVKLASGYLYSNVKTLKPDKPIGPIIYQIPSPAYRLAKSLNTLISPYIPSDQIIRSAEDFVVVLRANKPHGILASLDVAGLFTNVPVERTMYSYNTRLCLLR